MGSTVPGMCVLRFGPFEFEVANGLLRKLGKLFAVQFPQIERRVDLIEQTGHGDQERRSQM